MPCMDTLRLAEQLIALPSVTPDDAGCQELIAQQLRPLGFECEFIESGPAHFRVRNLWAKWSLPLASTENIAINSRATRPVFVFAGHTDVVPTGPLEQWQSPPFVPSHREARLYGRGASDMKTSLAAMVVATRQFLQAQARPAIDIAFLLTSDEEGPATDGTVVVCQALQERGQRLDYCIVGEPTSVQRTGDMIKNGRRGTMSGKLTVKGLQGHIAYPHLARNPIHLLAPALAELVQVQWDAGNDHFPPTTWQVSNIHAGTGASNVIPGQAVVDFNFRFSTESTAQGLRERLCAVLDRHGLDYDIAWTVGGLPFLTRPAALVDAVRHAIQMETGLDTELSTSGGTSDARFIAPICRQVVEVGPPNGTIHQIDECIALADIAPLTGIYRRTLEALHAAHAPT